MKNSMYFIGISPIHPIDSHIYRLKQWVYQKYKSKGALRSKAHITLQMPFHLSEKKEARFLSDLSRFSQAQNSFPVQLNGFGKFEPRVIFIKVEENTYLNELQKEIGKFMKTYQVFNDTHKNNGFHPHITIAFRDLKKPAFYQLWEEVKNKGFKEEFTAQKITLFKHNGTDWDVYQEFEMK
ncbi:MAG: 2'-5' RNA ligase family protein [Bacteroidota bacterium]